MGFEPTGKIVRKGAAEKRGSRLVQHLVGSSRERGVLSSVSQEVEDFKLGSHRIRVVPIIK